MIDAPGIQSALASLRSSLVEDLAISSPGSFVLPEPHGIIISTAERNSEACERPVFLPLVEMTTEVIDWPYSTFHLFAGQGVDPADWAGGDEDRTDYQEQARAMRCAY